MKKPLCLLLAVTMLFACSCSKAHTCESVCDICGKCTDSTCEDAACADKCEGHHICAHVCDTCGKCTDLSCEAPECADKCDGHPQPVIKTAAQLTAMGYKPEDESGRMFDASKSTGIYNYCPTVMETDDGVRHIYYCTNKDSFQVYDHIGYRKAIKASDTGVWYYSPESLVVSPPCYVSVWKAEDYAKDSFCWYSLHFCDPSVIRGSFKYNGHTYKYLMALLVCANPYCLDNEIALAVSDSPEGEWIVCDDSVNPVVKSKRKMADWGVGQPDIISIDGKGQVLMLYTMAGVGAVWQAYDFSDLQDVKTLSIINSPSKSGLENRTTGGKYTLYNSAYAFDKEAGVLYMITEKFPHAIEGEPTYPAQVGSVQELLAFSLTGDDLVEITKKCNASANSWSVLFTVDKSLSGKPRNHNACIIRDEYGYVSGDKIEVAVTVNSAGDVGNNETYLWDYRIARFTYEK